MKHQPSHSSGPQPLPVRRLPKQTLRHVWSPKLGRPIVFTSADQERLWVTLEVEPAVTAFCERPSNPVADDFPVDFWALKDGEESWITLVTDQASEEQSNNLESASPITTTFISTSLLDEHRVWIQNWLSLLPYLCTGSAVSLEPIRKEVLEYCTSECTLIDIEYQFRRIDPVVVRTSVIAELHCGRLLSGELRERNWDQEIRIVCDPANDYANRRHT